jgi:hypothetical protein
MREDWATCGRIRYHDQGHDWMGAPWGGFCEYLKGQGLIKKATELSLIRKFPELKRVRECNEYDNFYFEVGAVEPRVKFLDKVIAEMS